MALNWGKINKQDNQSQTTSGGLDWSKLEKKSTSVFIPVPTPTQNAFNILNNANKVQSYNDVTKPVKSRTVEPMPTTLSQASTPQTQAPTFETLDEALAYVNNNNIKISNTNIQAIKQIEEQKKAKELAEKKIKVLRLPNQSTIKTPYQMITNTSYGVDENTKKIIEENLNMTDEERFQKEKNELAKYYNSGATQANYISGNLSIRYNEAMAKYFKTQKPSDLEAAERIKELITLYNENAENLGEGGIIRKDFASYLPQLVEQTKSGVKGALVGAGAGALGGAGIGSVVPGAGTLAGGTTGALWGARGGYVAGVGSFSYDQMQGSAYSQLLDLGIPDEVAREVASDTALWQSVIEMTGAAIDLVSLGLGSKAVKGVAGKTAGQLTAKQLITNALKAYGVNLVEETAEEAVQEKIAIEQEKKAFEKAGLERTATNKEDWQRIIEAGTGGFKIALVSGSGNVIGNITATSINSSTIAKVNKTYDEQINEVKNSNLSEQEKQEQINNLENGREKTVNAIKDAMTETEGNKIIKVNNLQENIASQSPNTQIQQQTNEVIPQQTETQQNANLTPNNLQTYKAIRSDVENANLDAENKPQGLYLSNLYDKNVSDFSFPFKDSELNTTYEYDITPTKPLNVESFELQTDRSSSPIQVDAGVSALKTLVGDNEFNRINSLNKQQLQEELSSKYPQYDFSRYFDKLELMSAYGGIMAREQGYDAIIPQRSTNKWTEDVDNEIVALSNSILRRNNTNTEQISQNNVQNAQDLQKTGQLENKTLALPTNNTNGEIKRQDLLDLAKKFKHKGETFIDERYKNGKKETSNIIKYNEVDLNEKNINILRKLANDFAKKKYTDAVIKNADTGIDTVVGKKGIRETLSKDINREKLSAMDDTLIKSIEEAIYKESSLDTDSKNNIYHYLVSMIENGENQKALNYITIKETPNRNKFYYNTVEKIEDSLLPSRPGNNTGVVVNATNESPVNNIIQSNENYVNNNFPTQAEQQQAQQEKKNNSKPNFILVNEKDSYKRNMINNNAKAINDLIKAKTVITNELTQKINAKQQLYNSKKDKTTKIAQNLKTQIINLEKRRADIEEKLINKIDRLEKNTNINKLKKQVYEDRLPTRKEIKQDIITQTDLDNIDLDNIKDVSKWTMNNTIPLRVNEKIFDRETANKINDTFFRPIKHNEAERIRFLNKERAEIEALGIKPRSEESEYVQIYGEGEWVNPSTGEVIPYTLKDLQKKFPKSWEKIKQAAETIREKYDTYLDAVNKELNKMGYDSIPKLKNYFRHFEETTSLLDQIGIPSKADALPTDMNGLTSDLKPGKNFFANALSRTGKKTTYDAITGIDGYLEGVSKLMYHTEDIQKLRTFDEYIRGKYGKNSELEGLNKADFQKRVEQIQEGHLSEYASWLTEYTNTLAGKKSRMDRGMEEALGRRIYGTLNVIKKQVGSNLTGLNLNSALSNFISVTQGASKTSKLAMLEGFGDTVKNIFVKDNFINESDFLTRRFGSDKLSKTMWENISNAGQIFMAGTDYLSANIITRSKYYEYLNKGYPKNEAIKLADEFADRIMGGRALGDMPNIFNSKTLGILTQFQLENVNQFDAMFHDTKYENRAEEQTRYQSKTFNEKIKSNLAKKDAKLYNGLTATFVLGQLFAYAWAYNKLDEELTGSGGAFDPIGILENLIKDFMNKDLSKADALKNFAKNVIDAIPYANILTGGGRIPMTDALPNLSDLLEGESSVPSELWKLTNLALPTGGGQLRKSIQGAIAVAQGGEYKTNSKGEKQLKFPVAQDGSKKDKILEGAQAVLFGKWATPGGKRYIESGFKPLSKVQTEGIEKAQELGIRTSEFYEIKKKLQNIKVPKLKNKEGKEQAVPNARKKLIIEELNKMNLNDEQKKLFYDIFYTQELK